MRTQRTPAATTDEQPKPKRTRRAKQPTGNVTRAILDRIVEIPGVRSDFLATLLLNSMPPDVATLLVGSTNVIIVTVHRMSREPLTPEIAQLIKATLPALQSVVKELTSYRDAIERLKLDEGHVKHHSD